jgi:hypothetical protein
MVAEKPNKSEASAGPAPVETKPLNVESAVAETSPAYLVVKVRERVTEASAVPIFEAISREIRQHGSERVLVDLRDSTVQLTISDIFGVAKLTASTFAGVLERLALLVRPEHLLSEKFFEPSVSSRGIPALVTSDAAEAEYWITSKTKLPR